MSAKKVAVITGGSRGIGAATARELAAAGFNIVLACVSDVAGANTVAADIMKNGVEALVVQADVGKPEQIAALFDKVAGKFGHVDALINNAGMSGYGALAELSWEAVGRVLDVNLKSVIFCSAQAAPLFPATGGAIVNVGSVLASQPSGSQGLYAASKAGIEAMSRVMAQELGPRHIRVNVVAPGPTETALLPDDLNLRGYILSRTPLGRVGQPVDIARVIAFLCSDAAAWVTGQVIAADGGIRV